MLGGMRSKLRGRMSKLSVIGLSLLVTIGVMIISGFAGDIGRAMFYRLPSGGLGAAPIYDGPASLKERILESDVVARVKLLSMSPSVEAFGDERSGNSAYVSALEFRFEVLEYLKGGGGEIVGIVYGNDYYESKLGALTLGEDLTDTHDTTWDDREAIVFLSKGRGVLSTLEEPDRYVLGFADYGVFDSDSYTIDSRYSKRWLPAAAIEGVSVAHGAGSGGGEQRFLTGAERAEGESREELIDYRVANSAHNKALGTGGDSSMITLSQIKDLIADLQEEIDEGDGSEDYLECVLEKYKRNREVEYKYEASGGVTYGTISYDHELASGSPADTVFALGTRPFHPPDDYDPANHEYANPHFEWEGWIEGKDAQMFRVANNKSVIATTRPLHRGEYRFYFNSLDSKYIPCSAYPDRLRTSEELVVHVSALAGALHEAFFDPVDIDEGVGAGGGRGVLRPEWFETDDGETVIESIEWWDGQVEMELSPAADLIDYRMDLIALDGSVALRLDVIDAIEVLDEDEVATLIWGVCEQPWVDGDLLMLRIAGGTPDDGVQATNDAECLAAAQEHVTADAAEPTATLEPTPTPEPTAEPTIDPEPTATPAAEPTSTPEPTATAAGTTPTPEPTAEPTPEPEPTATHTPTAAATVATEPRPTSVPSEDTDSTASASPPPAPENLTAVLNEDGTATLTWDAPDDDSTTGYRILRQRPAEGEDALLVYVEDTGSTDTSYTDVDVTAGIQHLYSVKAINDAGLSEPSNSVQVNP